MCVRCCQELSCFTVLLRRCLSGATREGADVEYGGLSCPLRVAVLSGSCPCGLPAVLLASCVALGQPPILSSIAFCACTVFGAWYDRVLRI